VATPVLHLLAGPNGAGKTTCYGRVLAPVTHLPFINADLIARRRWPGEETERAYQAAALAEEQRRAAMAEGRSFVTETVFSHPSKVDLLADAGAAGYLRHLHVLLIPEDLCVARVENRVEVGGHPVPEEKIRQRFRRLWELVRQGIDLVEKATVMDNSRAREPFRTVARFERGALLSPADWPPWTPEALKAAGT
jgi:predicted ABC-type ATPase